MIADTYPSVAPRVHRVAALVHRMAMKMWGVLVFGLLGMPLAWAEPKPSQPELLEVQRIWDQAPHNAFTDLIRFKDKWFCVFREGAAHVSPDGAIRVLMSEDGRSWHSAALLKDERADLRDAKITVTPDSRLMLSGAGAMPQGSDFRHQSMTWFSDDGINWSKAHAVADRDFWLWRTTWHENTAYGVAYRTNHPTDRTTRLYRSDDGKQFETWVDNLFDDGYPNESSLVFAPDGTGYCLLRRDAGEKTGQLGIAQSPYRDWKWLDLGVRIGGPHIIQLPDGRLLAAVRLYDGGARTSLCWVDAEKGTLDECLKLPSAGDTSYAGMLWHDDHLWVSYYSAHEATEVAAKTSIYFAKVAIPERLANASEALSDAEIAAMAGEPGRGAKADEFGERIEAAIRRKPVAKNGVGATHHNVSYGPHARNRFDIWLVESDQPAPLVIFIHGGGFKRGDKSLLYDSDLLVDLTAAGISVAGVNYRYYHQDARGVLASLDDVRLFVQYIRQHADRYNIDKHRVGCYGGSAGAAASLWLAFHDDMADPQSDDPMLRESTRIRCAGAMASPATLDLLQWKSILGLPEFSPKQMQEIADNFGLDDVSDIDSEKGSAIRARLDMLALMSADDPPVFVFNNEVGGVPTTTGHMGHHPNHAMVLKQRADQVGIEAVVSAPKIGLVDPSNDSLKSFLIRQLVHSAP